MKPLARCAIFMLMMIGLAIATPASFAAGGTCPSGANYLHPSNLTGSLVTLSSLGVTSCYYISASGSDSNNGTSESTPWLHAPGMPNCSSACASVTPAGGEGFIIEGGSTYHRAASTAVAMGGEWVWSWNGSSGSPIYVGIDPTWYSGSSFTRPVFNWDNPLSVNTVSSCTFDSSGTWLANFSGRSNVTVDGLEVTGACSTGSSRGGYFIEGSSASVTFERFYSHGWTLTTTAADDILVTFSSNASAGQNNHYYFNVIDGSDSTYGTACTNPACIQTISGNGGTGWGYDDCYDLEYNVTRHTSNAVECSEPVILIGNLIEYDFEPAFGGRHGNAMEALGGRSGATCEFYNNITRNIAEGVNWWPQCDTAYVFNNVWENDSHFPPDPNGLIMSPTGFTSSSKVTHWILANNTFDNTIASQATGGNGTTPGWASGSTVSFENTYVVGTFTQIFGSTNNFFSCNGSSGGNCAETDNGGEAFQTLTNANAQGYTLSNDFAPTSGTGVTVGAGNNMTSNCSTFSSDSALCSGTPKGVLEQSGWGGYVASYPAIPVIARLSSWDAGAYEFSSSSTNQPAAPTGLVATVQ